METKYDASEKCTKCGHTPPQQGGECDCKTWAETDLQSGLLGNGHNTNCEHFKRDVRAVVLLERLVTGIHFWGSLEDGVPDEVWEAYKEAHFIARGSFPKEQP